MISEIHRAELQNWVSQCLKTDIERFDQQGGVWVNYLPVTTLPNYQGGSVTEVCKEFPAVPENLYKAYEMITQRLGFEPELKDLSIRFVVIRDEKG